MNSTIQSNIKIPPGCGKSQDPSRSVETDDHPGDFFLDGTTMKKGYIKLWRKILDSPSWFNSTPEQKVILITLLAKANHKSAKWDWGGNEFVVGPGEFVTSLESIAKAAGPGVSIRNVRTALKRFENLEFLTNKSTKHGRLIKIINWDVYQSLDSLDDKEGDKRVTNDRQTGDKRVTPNKNVKNVKNDKEEIIYPDWLDMEVWSEFKKYRKNGKGKFTVYAQQLAIKKLEKLKAAGNDPSEVLKQTIEHGWSGLFEISQTYHNPTKPKILTDEEIEALNA